MKYDDRVFLFFMVLSLGGLGGCGNPPQNKSNTQVFSKKDPLNEEEEARKKLREKNCPSVREISTHLQNPLGGSSPKSNNLRLFPDIRQAVNAACASCHLVPARTGGFSYVDSARGKEVSVGGETRFYPGFSESASALVKALLHEDPKIRMPPVHLRQQNPEYYLQLAKTIQTWINEGQPADPSDQEGGGARENRELTSELGNCIPEKSTVGFDFPKDKAFARMEKLPSFLHETDLFTLDSHDLAQKGTLSYNIEYPLWTDDTHKARHIHLPLKIEDGKLVQQTIPYQAREKIFTFPENTRFYKTFFREVKDKTGKFYLRRVETRLIVVRYPYSRALFGTYRWSEDQKEAKLVDIPYRDGTPFKDQIFPITVDESTEKTRKYALPGRHRCVECHMGSENNSFILGFTPLQINRRSPGAAAEELSQANRFIQYGMFSGVSHPEDFPRLEWMGQKNPRNTHELKAQGYMVGNCSHCHNPKGFAFTKENGVTLNLSAGEIFDFNTHTMSTQRKNKQIVHHSGDLDQSHLYFKVSAPPGEQGMLSQMPMHSPGIPDCKAVTLIGRWIKSWEGIEAAENWTPKCTPKDDFPWIDQDFTWPATESYTPRRDDWADPRIGMPERPYRDLQFSQELQNLADQEFAVGYWNKKDNCRFPEVNLPVHQQRPWMMRGSTPKRPFGEVYSTTPGSWFFRTTCAKCHGNEADGNTALARGILNWSGGSVRVANLKDGLFGRGGQNGNLFHVTTPDGLTRNLAPNYLIWMAMEGTRVKFPEELSILIGKHGGQMLNQVREKCLRQISPEKSSSPLFPDHEIFRQICFFENLTPDDPKLRFNLQTGLAEQPAEVEKWLDKGAYNAGFSIYQFLDEGNRGKNHPGNDECEKVFP